MNSITTKYVTIHGYYLELIQWHGHRVQHGLCEQRFRMRSMRSRSACLIRMTGCDPPMRILRSELVWRQFIIDADYAMVHVVPHQSYYNKCIFRMSIHPMTHYNLLCSIMSLQLSLLPIALHSFSILPIRAILLHNILFFRVTYYLKMWVYTPLFHIHIGGWHPFSFLFPCKSDLWTSFLCDYNYTQTTFSIFHSEHRNAEFLLYAMFPRHPMVIPTGVRFAYFICILGMLLYNFPSYLACISLFHHQYIWLVMYMSSFSDDYFQFMQCRSIIPASSDCHDIWHPDGSVGCHILHN